MGIECSDIPWGSLGFWTFVIIFFIYDCYMFNQGYDTFFQTHKSEIEKEIQKIKLDKLKKERK